MKITRRGATAALLYVSMAMAIAWLLFLRQDRIRLLPAGESPVAEGLFMSDFQGGRVDLVEYRGKVVLVNLWASWCGPCVSELPGLVRVHEKYRNRGLVVLGLNVDEVEPGQVLRISEDLGIPYPVVLRAGPLREPFRTDGTIPHTWLVDRQGRLRASHSGYVSEGSLVRACGELLEES